MGSDDLVGLVVVPVVVGLLILGWMEVDACSACRALCADRGAAVESSGFAACMCRTADRTLIAVDRKGVPNG